MITIETNEIKISEELKKKIEKICRFTNTNAKYQNGSVRNLKGKILILECNKLFTLPLII